MVPMQTQPHAWRTAVRMRREIATILALAALVATAAVVLNVDRPSGVAQGDFEVRNQAHLTVSALPGVDLAPITSLPGISAASGPFPTFVTGARHGHTEADVALEGRSGGQSVVNRAVIVSGKNPAGPSVVLEQDLARALDVQAGGHITVSSAHGPTSLLVAGTAARREPWAGGRPGLGYVTPQTLTRLAPNAHTHGSALYLRVADPARSKRYVDWIRQTYPPHQVSVHDTRRIEKPGGFTPGLTSIGGLAASLALVLALGCSAASARHTPARMA
jgi:hypothetical protein